MVTKQQVLEYVREHPWSNIFEIINGLNAKDDIRQVNKFLEELGQPVIVSDFKKNAWGLERVYSVFK